MKIIYKPIKELYPRAKLIFSYDIWTWNSPYILYSIMYTIFLLGATITAISYSHYTEFDISNYLWIYVAIYLWLEFSFWSEHWVKKVYLYKEELIFNLFGNLNIIINFSEISYILLRRFEYKNNKIQILKWRLFSLYPGIIFQVGLFRFRLESMYNTSSIIYKDPSMVMKSDFMFKLIDDERIYQKFINNYDFIFNWKHKLIETKLHLRRFLSFCVFIFTMPFILIFKILRKCWILVKSKPVEKPD